MAREVFEFLDTKVRVILHLRTNPDQAPGTRNPIIDLILLTDRQGDRVLAEKMLAIMNEKYVGKPLSEWPL